MHKCFLMSFSYNKKMKKYIFFQIWKNAQVFSNEFLLHRIEWKNAHVFTNEFLLQRYSNKMHKSFLLSFSDKHDDRRTAVQTDIHLPPSR